MSTPISALEQSTTDLIREVSPEAISFYVDELSGIFLPEDFRAEHHDVFDVEFWKPEKRLNGKFGRFTLKHTEGAEVELELDDVLVMGTTIGVGGLDRTGYMHSLRHYALGGLVPAIVQQRGIDWNAVEARAVDYGSTTIVLDAEGQAAAIKVGGDSIDFGRANSAGRQKTCELFEKHLASTSLQIINSDPEPREHERIIK